MSDPIRERIDWLDDDDYAAPLADALRAVLDLHKPVEVRYEQPEGHDSDTGPICGYCSYDCQDDYWYSYNVDYPCPTVVAIAEAIGPGPAPRTVPDYLTPHEFLGDAGKMCWWRDTNGYMCCMRAGNVVHL